MVNTENTAPPIGSEQVALLEKLCNASGVAGDEGEVRSILLEAVRPLADEVHVDALGNVLAIRRARGTSPQKVMLDAHMDEVGLMIVSEDDGGMYRFVKVGGIDDRALPGKGVLVGKDHTPGVIGAKAIHLTEPGELDNKIPVDALRIDLGPGGKAKPGDRAVFATRFQQVGPSFIAKSIDDRSGCCALVEILRQAKETGALDHLELLFSFSVQEEIFGRGARVAAYGFDPDLALVIDTTPAYDLPLYDEGEDGTEENARYNARLGLGPALYIADAGTLSDPRLVSHIMRTAEAHGIPFQVRQPGSGGTNAGAIHRVRAGVPSVSLSTPSRYLHTAASLSRRSDFESTVALAWWTLVDIHSLTFSERS